MVSLRLKGPHRRTDVRAASIDENRLPTTAASPQEEVKMKSNAPASPSPLRRTRAANATSAASTPAHQRTTRRSVLSSAPIGDVINVQHRMATTTIRDESGEGSPPTEPQEVEEDAKKTDGKPSSGNSAAPNRPWAPAGKAPARDVVLSYQDSNVVVDDDNVEEYIFSSESEDESDSGQDTEWYKVPVRNNGVNVITISSDDDIDERDSEWDLNGRPWKDMDEKARYQWEMMYCNVADFPMGNDWSRTEDFQREKDKEMLRYIEDFPLPQWVIPAYIATDAYNRLLERTRWRGLGIHIYGRERIPEWIPGSTKPMQRSHAQAIALQTPLNMPPHRYPREVPPASHLPNAVPPPPPPPSQPSMQPGMPNGTMSYSYSPQSMPPPHQPSAHPVLPSQPNAQPIPTYPNGVPIYRPPTGSIGLPSGVPHHMANIPNQPPRPMYSPVASVPSDVGPQNNKGKGRAKKYTPPPTESQVAPPPTPPYDLREKPSDRRGANKTGRRSGRRQAEAEEFPWNRQINFQQARANATWDASGYIQATLDGMAEIRRRNEPIIEKIDQQEAERQRQTRLLKKQGPKTDGSSDAERRKGGPKRKSSMLSGAEGGTGDPYHSGHYCFATDEDAQRAKIFGMRGPDDIMLAVEDGLFTVESCRDVMISWNPGKKGVTQDLVQAAFSIRDTLITRQQLETTPILTRRAAECIVDFCPDMLWRGMLLRIASEAGYGNKDVRDRMCLNGNYCDKATITKRIGSALGQKQQQSTAKARKKGIEPAAGPAEPAVQKVKGYAKGEDEYYNANVIDFANYVDFFGKRTSHRGQLSLRVVGSKRKIIALDDADASSGADAKTETKTENRENLGSEGVESVQSGEPMDEDDEGDRDDAGGTSAAEGGSDQMENDADAVSVQSDTMLDEMDDD